MTFRIKLFMLLEIRVSQPLAVLGVALKLLLCEARESRNSVCTQVKPCSTGLETGYG